MGRRYTPRDRPGNRSPTNENESAQSLGRGVVRRSLNLSFAAVLVVEAHHGAVQSLALAIQSTPPPNKAACAGDVYTMYSKRASPLHRRLQLHSPCPPSSDTSFSFWGTLLAIGDLQKWTQQYTGVFVAICEVAANPSVSCKIKNDNMHHRRGRGSGFPGASPSAAPTRRTGRLHDEQVESGFNPGSTYNVEHVNDQQARGKNSDSTRKSSTEL